MHRTLVQAAQWLLESAVDGCVETEGSNREAGTINWLKYAPLKVLHPLRWQLCVAALGRLALVPLREDFGHTSVGDSKPILLQLCTPPEHITALAWACFARADGRGCKESCVLVGTSSGHLLLLSEDGDLLHRQRLHTSAVTGIALRAAGYHAHDATEDVTVCFEDAVARFTSLELHSVVALRKSVGHFSKWPTLGCNKWDTSRGAGPRAGALCAGAEEPGLYAVMTSRDAASRLLLLTVGRSPPVAAFKAEEHATQGTLSLVTDVASAMVAGVAGLARTAVVGREGGYRAGLRQWLQKGGQHSPHSPDRPASPATPPSEAGKEDAPPGGEPAVLWRSLRDDARAVTSLLAAPRGTLAAAADSLGRVLLLDCAAAAVLRVFKGYRAAQCAWLSLRLPRTHRASPPGPDEDTGSLGDSKHQAMAVDAAEEAGAQGRHVESGEARQQARGWFGGGERAEAQLCLALHAPWRGIVDVWAMTHGGKLCSLGAGPGCCLLAAPPVFGRAEQSGAHAGRGGGGGEQQQGAWMLNCASGALWSVEAAVLEALA